MWIIQICRNLACVFIFYFDSSAFHTWIHSNFHTKMSRLSIYLKDRIYESDTQLVFRFKIQNCPAFIVLNIVYSFDVYDKEIKSNSIMSFLKEIHAEKHQTREKLKKRTGSFLFQMAKCSKPEYKYMSVVFFKPKMKRMQVRSMKWDNQSPHEQPYIPFFLHCPVENELSPITPLYSFLQSKKSNSQTKNHLYMHFHIKTKWRKRIINYNKRIRGYFEEFQKQRVVEHEDDYTSHTRNKLYSPPRMNSMLSLQRKGK